MKVNGKELNKKEEIKYLKKCLVGVIDNRDQTLYLIQNVATKRNQKTLKTKNNE